jgi:hypothetical protein
MLSILVGLPLLCAFSDPVLNSLHVQDNGVRRIVGVLLICLLLTPGAFWDWRSGFYALAGAPPKGDHNEKEQLKSNSL